MFTVYHFMSPCYEYMTEVLTLPVFFFMNIKTMYCVPYHTYVRLFNKHNCVLRPSCWMQTYQNKCTFIMWWNWFLQEGKDNTQCGMKKNGCLTLLKLFIKFYIEHKTLLQNKFECTTMKLECMYLCVSTGIILITLQ